MGALKIPLSTLFGYCVFHVYTGVGAPTINVLARTRPSFHLCPGAHSGSPLSSRLEPKSTLAIIFLHLGQASLLPPSPLKSINSFPLRTFLSPLGDENKQGENNSYQSDLKSRTNMAVETVKEPKAQPFPLLPLFLPTSSAKSTTARGPHSHEHGPASTKLLKWVSGTTNQLPDILVTRIKLCIFYKPCIGRQILLPPGFPHGLVVKNPPADEGVTGSIPGPGRSPGEGYGNPLLEGFLPGESHG